MHRRYTWMMNRRWNVQMLKCTHPIQWRRYAAGAAVCAAVLGMRLLPPVVVLFWSCLPVYHSVWFVGSHCLSPPFLTGLSSNLPEDSVSSAVFKIQFRCMIQICFGEQRGRQTHYVKRIYHLLVFWKFLNAVWDLSDNFTLDTEGNPKDQIPWMQKNPDKESDFS